MMTALESLTLQYNKLDTLPVELASLPNLHIVDVRDNKLMVRFSVCVQQHAWAWLRTPAAMFFSLSPPCSHTRSLPTHSTHCHTNVEGSLVVAATGAHRGAAGSGGEGQVGAPAILLIVVVLVVIRVKR